MRVFELDWRHEGPASAAAAAARTWEDQIGDDPGPGEWFEVGQGQIAGFSSATLNPGDTAEVQPMFLLSLLTHLVGTVPVEWPGEGLVMGVNYGFDGVRFGEPVPAGSRIRARSVPGHVEQKGTAVNVTTEVTVEVDGRESPALTAKWIGRGQYSS